MSETRTDKIRARIMMPSKRRVLALALCLGLIAGFLLPLTASVSATTPSPTPTPNTWVTNGEVKAIVNANGITYIGGSFTQVGPVGGPMVTRNRIAAIDATTGAATSWDPNASDVVLALAVSGTTVYAGGSFTTIGGQARSRIAALNATTGLATGWNPNATGSTPTVTTLAVSGDGTTVYAGGNFATIGGLARPYIASLNNTTGAANAAFNATAGGNVFVLTVSGTTVYVSGNFMTIGGQSRLLLGAVDATTGLATGWNPQPDNEINAIVVSGTTVYVGGIFMAIGMAPRFGLAAIDATTGLATAWNPDASTGSVVALAFSGTTVYAGGSFNRIGMAPRNGLAAIDANTGATLYWDPIPTLYSYTNAIAVSGTTVYAGGSFTTIGGASRPYFAQFSPPNPVPTITGLSPSSATAGGPGFTLTVNGTNFEDVSRVRWNGADRTTTYVSATQLTAAIPASDLARAGTIPVAVSTTPPGGGSSNSRTFTVNSAPQDQEPSITSISPISGSVGTTVTIKGADFGASRGTSYVEFNTKEAAPTDYVSWSSSQIKVKVPTGATTGPVTVTTANGTSNGETFTVTTAWYLAEGSTAWGFSQYISIINPNPEAVTARVTYMTTTGPTSPPNVTLPASSQTTINPRDYLGDQDFSTKVECLDNKTIAVDRTMTWTGPGAASPEAHNSVGVTSPEKTWYLAEGSSAWGFECWLLIQNPNSSEATCQVTYMMEGAGPNTVTKTVPANSRRTYDMSKDIGNHDASIKVESNIPVIPERAMYRNNRREGHDSIGTTAPATDYYLAEGTTAWGFTTYVLIQNPNPTPTDVIITYMTPSGPKPQPKFTMSPSSRKTIKVNDIPEVSNTDLSTAVHGSQPIIAERAMYWNNGTGEACHDSIGMAAPHTTFYLPDGETSNGRETWTLVQNPNDTDVTVEISYLTPNGQGNVIFQDTVPKQSRKTYNMVAKGIGGRAAVMVRSLDPAKKIMCERAMYWNSRGAGTDTIGAYSD